MVDRVRLACVRRTASVHSELGSNSFKRNANYFIMNYKVVGLFIFLSFPRKLLSK